VFDKPKKTIKDLMTIQEILIRSNSLNYSLSAVKIRAAQANRILSELHLQSEYRTLIGDSLFKLFQQSQTVADRYGIKITIF